MGLIRKSLTLLLGEGAARALGILSFALLARFLSLEDFGTFSFAMSTALMLAVLIDMGQNSHLTRLTAKDPRSIGPSLARAILNKTAVGIVVVILTGAVLLAFDFSGGEVRLVVLMGGWATLLSMLDSMRSVARAMGKMSLDSLINGLESLTRLIAIVLAWVCGVSLEGYAMAFILEAAVACVVFAAILTRAVDVSILGHKPHDMPRLLGDSWTLGIMGVAMAGFNRIDQVLIQGIAGSGENALYGAAARVAFTATVGASLVLMAGYPELSGAAARGSSAYPHALRRVLVLSGGVGIVAAIVVVLAAEPIVGLLYGADYTAAIPLLRVLALVVAANSITIVGVYSASALGRERLAVLVAFGMIAVNVVSNLVVIPRYGVLGATWVSAVGEVVLAAGMLWISRDLLLLGNQRTGAVSGAC